MYKNTDIGNVWKNDQEPELFERPFAFKSEQAQEAWELGFKKQGESELDESAMGAAYGRCCYVFAVRWARRMENAIEANPGSRLEDIAENLCTETDRTPDMGISGNQYGMVVSILSGWWFLGDDLRRWHNRKYDQGAKDTEERVINPAVLIVNIPDE